MRPEAAAELINASTFHNDYMILAAAAGERVAMTIAQETYDSSSVSPSGQYRRRSTVAPVMDFDPAGLDTDGVLFEVLKKLGEFHDHEAREFLRVYRGGRWVAPFHPHTREGHQNWDKRGGRVGSNAA